MQTFKMQSIVVAAGCILVSARTHTYPKVEKNYFHIDKKNQMHSQTLCISTTKKMKVPEGRKQRGRERERERAIEGMRWGAELYMAE